ncbi:MAG: hypothetical protein CMM93_02745 [Rickettsiales bacterium]|nr:hypothetical protein [Rickettsiales bacterium]|tara:strand:- start:1345 stop:2517 length:1173 start_codon:yes stop_codon:yes gene_type:complete
MALLHQSRFLEGFQCLGAECEDTCCKGWGMQLTQETVNKYKSDAPELLEAVTSGEAAHIMKRDPNTDYCVKYDQGWCGIHAQYGTDFLGDACHFFPRVTRQLGEASLMTASLSCPEVARLTLLEADAFAIVESSIDRLPFSLKHYVPEGLTSEQTLAIHQACLAMVDDAPSAERALAWLRSVAESLPCIDLASWPMAVPFYLKQADSRLPNAEPKAEDPFNLVHALQGLISAAKTTARPRLEQTLQEMASALHIALDIQTRSFQTAPDSWQAWQIMEEYWELECAEAMAPILKRWLQAQLSVAFFPFAGLGESMVDRVTILGVRFATVKLALMAACRRQKQVIDSNEVIRIVQSLSRFLDHLADPTLSLQIYAETGWTREARLLSLIGES